jgi:hypothetical protein
MPACWDQTGVQPAVDDVLDDHTRRRRPVQTGHRHEDQGRASVQQSCEIGAEERRYAERLYPMVQEAMRDGIYPPRRASPLCSRRYCGYWRECEREFGGHVAE